MDRPANQFRVSRLRSYRAPALVMLLLHLAGCTTMRPITLDVVANDPPERVRVTTAQDQLSIADPRLTGDTLTGELLNERNRPTGLTWSTPVDSVREVAMRVHAPGRTAIALLLGVPAVMIVILLVDCSTADDCFP